MANIITKGFRLFLSKLTSLQDVWFDNFSMVDSSTILFVGKPDFSDNPRALCEYMVNHGYTERFNIVYAVADLENENVKNADPHIKFVRLSNSLGVMPLATRRYMYTAKYTFASHGFYVPINKYKEGQNHILLWHGCGYKAAGTVDGKRSFDKALVPGPLFVNTKCKYWNTTPEYILAKGYPRYDWMLHPTSPTLNFFNELKSNYSKVIIWMPTYRNSVANKRASENIITAFPLLDGMKDFLKLDEYCRSKNVLLLLKLHMSQKTYDIQWEILTNIMQITNKDFDVAKVNMYEFLPLTDGLISDYSSVAVDYLIADKPIAYTLDDFDMYSKARGFVFENPLDYMPGHHLYKMSDLENFIDDIIDENDLYKDARARMKNFAIVSSTNYCKDILNELNI